MKFLTKYKMFRSYKKHLKTKFKNEIKFNFNHNITFDEKYGTISLLIRVPESIAPQTLTFKKENAIKLESAYIDKETIYILEELEKMLDLAPNTLGIYDVVRLDSKLYGMTVALDKFDTILYKKKINIFMYTLLSIGVGCLSYYCFL